MLWEPSIILIEVSLLHLVEIEEATPRLSAFALRGQSDCTHVCPLLVEADIGRSLAEEDLSAKTQSGQNKGAIKK